VSLLKFKSLSKFESCHLGFLICSALLTTGCSNSGDSNNNATAQPQSITTRIEGTVVEHTSAEPILNAVVYTDPATNVIRTDLDGKFQITDGFTGSGDYRIFVEHDAYNNQQKTVSVAENGTSIADFVLTSSAIGLHTNKTQLLLTDDVSRDTFRLSSNIQNTGFSILNSDPWLSVSPQSGVINNRETVVIEVNIDRALLPEKLPVDSEIVINADNGTRSVVVSVQISKLNDASVAENTETNDQQLDCRRPDIFRTGLNNPLEPLIQFLPSVQLPDDVGVRKLQIINPFLVDSFVVKELGNIVIAHVGGDSTASSMAIYQWDLDQNLITMATNYGASPDNLRSRISYGLQPGVYCYAVYPLFEMFNNPENLHIQFDFIPPQ